MSYAEQMIVAVALAAFVFAFALAKFVRSRKSTTSDDVKDSTPALDGWIASVLEDELAETALGITNATSDERKKLTRSLRGDPDPDVVGRIEDAVRTVELEFVRYAHEQDAEVALRVRYENGKDAPAKTKRVSWSDVPEAVRADFERRGSTHVFRTWVFPWARVRAL